MAGLLRKKGGSRNAGLSARNLAHGHGRGEAFSGGSAPKFGRAGPWGTHSCIQPLIGIAPMGPQIHRKEIRMSLGKIVRRAAQACASHKMRGANRPVRHQPVKHGRSGKAQLVSQALRLARRKF